MDNFSYRKSNRLYTEKDLPAEGEHRTWGIALNRDDMQILMRLQHRRQRENGRVPGITALVREALVLLDKHDCPSQKSHKRKWDHIPAAPGVYFLYRGDECFYVGSSQNMRRRMYSNHHTQGFEPPRCEYEIVPSDKLAERELFHIQRLKPKMNILGLEGKYKLRGENHG